jgi:hypothetical protein
MNHSSQKEHKFCEKRIILRGKNIESARNEPFFAEITQNLRELYHSSQKKHRFCENNIIFREKMVAPAESCIDYQKNKSYKIISLPNSSSFILTEQKLPDGT